MIKKQEKSLNRSLRKAWSKDYTSWMNPLKSFKSTKRKIRMISAISARKLGNIRKISRIQGMVWKKKGKPCFFVCFESNLTEVPYNTWWIGYGSATYVANMMKEFLFIQTIKSNENFV